MQKAVRAIVSGRVQGVWYRDFARRKAHAFGVVGSAANLPDGTVEVIAEGTEDTLEEFLYELRRGSFFSRVKDVQVEWRAPLGTFTNFDIIS